METLVIKLGRIEDVCYPEYLSLKFLLVKDKTEGEEKLCKEAAHIN